MPRPVVFISYSHDNAEHRERVLRLSERLRADGFETRLDQYVNGSPAEGWPRWMLSQLEAADWVLVVCTETYYLRFRGSEPDGPGKGGNFEGLNITQELYDARNRNTKFVPVLFDPADAAFIPEPLRPVNCYVMTSADEYKSLLETLSRLAGIEPGPIGPMMTAKRRTGTPMSFEGGALLRASDFSIEEPDARRLYDLLVQAYPKKARISGLLEQTRIREKDVETDGTVGQVWLAVLQYAARSGLLRDLIETASKDASVADFHAALQELLEAGGGPALGSVSGDESLLSEVDQLLASVGRSRSPIIIAIEVEDEPLTEFELARTACHLMVTLTPAQVESVETLARAAMTDVASVADLTAAGQQVWQELTAVERRLQTLHARIAGKGPGQPVAWCARAELLERLAPALQIAHTGNRGARGFLSVGAGSHYFTPVHDARRGADVRTMKHRSDMSELSVEIADVRTLDSDLARVALGMAAANILIAVRPEDQPALTQVADVVTEDVLRPTRAVLAFGGQTPIEEIDRLLQSVPFVAEAPVDIAQPVLETLRVVLRRYADEIALPCIVSAVRAVWVTRGIDADDAIQCRQGLMWGSWSWVGLPLFARSYREVERPLYPHLMDLRSVASREWYFDRKQRIADAYQSNELARPPTGEVERFHLYLSGAGGTGKSCFLHHVYDQIDARPTSIAVWYRVDTPSSSWENVESRIREETLAAIGDKLDRPTADAVAELPPGLTDFLPEAAKLLRQRAPGFDEIVVFIDQLERTFESGDEPNPYRLEAISTEFVHLLQRVGTDNNVRVFVASRKQYLPDFLISYRAAKACALEFNVLQAISDENERTAFLHRILEWCSNRELVAPGVRMSVEATKTLVGHLDGNPLNMMLALIYIMSQNFAGVITENDVRRYEPWNRLFLLDLAEAERDELDWHFLLAMAHARTEIVRFEEVWWRIRMVRAPLTRRVDDLRRGGVIERMWLLGLLGRTVHSRPLGNEPVRFVEFFHANLRDYLLREVMGHGRSAAGVGGRYGGTPLTWRALDRLSVFAHDWAQTLQPLLAEEIHVLMEHRTEVVQAALVPDEDDTPPFYLLFLRDSSNARNELCRAAMACFAYSALVHDEHGKWAVETLFPDITTRVSQCEDWLRRSPQELRLPILRYLISLETSAAREKLVELLLDLPDGVRDEIAQATAVVLAEALYAARFRNEVLLLILSAALRRVGGEVDRVPAHVPALVVAACGRERETVLGVISYCVDRLSTSEDANLRELAPSLERFTGVDEWLGEINVGPFLGSVSAAERDGARTAALGLVLGSHVRSAVPEGQLGVWSAAVRDRLGVPLPDLELVDGEVEADEVELRYYGHRFSRSVFRPGLLRVSKRLWELSGRARVAEVVQGTEGGEDVLWLPVTEVTDSGYPFAADNFDEAMTGWLESRCRRSFDQLFDIEVQLAFFREVAATEPGRRRLRRIGPPLLRRVLVQLVEEAVPLGSRDSFLEQLADLVQTSKESDRLAQRMREYLRADICRSVADAAGQITTILLAEQLEQHLADRVDAQGRLDLTPAAAIRLDEAIRRHVVRIEEHAAGPPLVLITIPQLRSALARLLHRLDYRLPVLSFTELEEDVISVPGGLVDVVLEPQGQT